MLCWLAALPAVTAFYLYYEVMEEIIRKRRKPANPPESKLPIQQSIPTEPPDKHDWPLPIHGYDTAELFREDA